MKRFSPSESIKESLAAFMALLGILKPLKEWQQTGRKPARLSRFAAERFEKLEGKGILFPI